MQLFKILMVKARQRRGDKSLIQNTKFMGFSCIVRPINGPKMRSPASYRVPKVPASRQSITVRGVSMCYCVNESSVMSVRLTSTLQTIYTSLLPRQGINTLVNNANNNNVIRHKQNRQKKTKKKRVNIDSIVATPPRAAYHPPGYRFSINPGILYPTMRYLERYLSKINIISI